MGAAVVKVTDNVTKTEVDDLRTDTTGDITLTSLTEDKGDLATINGFADVILSTANITVTDNVDKSEADTIDAYSNTSGTVTLTSITDTVSNITAVNTNANISLATSAITVTDAASFANADAINGFTTGKVTLNSVEDTYAKIQDIKSIPDGEVDMGAAAVKVTNNVTKTEVDDLRTDTTGNITLTSLTEDKGNLCLLYTSDAADE